MCGARNPMLQMLYCTLVYTIWSVFEAHVYPFLSAGHRAAALASVCATSGIFAWATMSEAQGARAEFPEDALFPANKTCATCETPKFPRSKHCSLCKRCVHRFDHHCHFLNTCVGRGNLLPFHAFMAATYACTYYCSLLSVMLVLQSGSSLWGASVPALLGVFTFFAATSVAMYHAFHLWLLVHGQTLNEWVKRRRARRAYEENKARGLPVPHASLLDNPYDQGSWLANARSLLFA